MSVIFWFPCNCYDRCDRWKIVPAIVAIDGFHMSSYDRCDCCESLGTWVWQHHSRHSSNRPLPRPKNAHFQNEAKYTTFLVKMSFICIRIKNHTHIKGWALNLVLIQRLGGTRKWPIQHLYRLCVFFLGLIGTQVEFFSNCFPAIVFIVLVSIFCENFVLKAVVFLHFFPQVSNPMISRYSWWQERTHCILIFLLSLRSLESGFHIIGK